MSANASPASPLEPGDILDRRVAWATEEARTEWQLQVTEDPFTKELGSKWVVVVADNDNNILQQPAWAPLPGSQVTFLSSPVFETMYHGTRGNGKTLTLLMDFAQEVGKGYGSAWRGIIFRKTFGDLDDVVRKIEEYFPKMFPGFRFLKSKSDYTAIWPTGEALLLRPMEDERDYESYHGHEYPWIGWEELTQWENDKAYRLMFSCCRPTAPGIPCRVRATTNPYGVGHNWVKKRFRLKGRESGELIRIPGEVPRIAIRGMLSENFPLLHTSPNYPQIIAQAAMNPAQAQAWLHCDWSVNSGGMIDDIFNPRIHVIPNIPAKMIPHGWRLTRAYDHGQSHPFAVGWWAESNGEPVKIDGKYYGSVRGDLILLAEWYGTNGNDNEGLRMPARQIAQGIIDREEDMGLVGRVRPGPADTEIYTKDSSGMGMCPADQMEKLGIFWERADKTPGSRKRGWTMLRNFLQDSYPEADGTRDKPGLFVCKQCKYWQELVAPMPRDTQDPDDVPMKYEDHMADMTRYRVNWAIPGMWRTNF